MQHYFTNNTLSLNETFLMSNDIAHHFISVLRSNNGDKFEIVDSNHRLFIAEVIDKDVSKAKVIETKNKSVELPVDVTIICGLPKKDKSELIVQKATELGVDHIIFLQTAWSIAQWKNNKVSKKINRLSNIVRSAAEQSHRNKIPDVKYLDSINDLLKESYDHKLIAYEESAKNGEKADLINSLNNTKPADSIAAFFGPEGGISPDEVSRLKANGYKTCGLGPRILRTETAPLYFLSSISMWFDLLK
ncbi:16S rRNA (uracil(1498)-N(3))-methyltransferase [Apilactobacillus timberlakei]|uniref:16S rRNA (uracil(1498)-N(3))-methyltransferase n=1 Tax=Apilactobacillus timberlakei TaxID=2008380 RepID=UPI00112DF693|nr:16S rRNA (uracil(1498)-N(3))-methyltransferase [Apilactobacillus timberlakei]TPR17458.1 16S rRNA (uracil(1498)-N(3))-methyltransferase [Apilactobacillus timberlakei]